MSKIIKYVISILAICVHNAYTQSTGSSDCTYIFRVPQSQQDTCPGNQMSSQEEEDDGLTKKQLSNLVSNQQEQLALLTRLVNEQNDRLQALENGNGGQSSSSDDFGVNYIRWGRSVCPDTSILLYEGFAAKSYYNHAGGGANYICLHRVPQWPSGVQAGLQEYSRIYGIEYQDMQVLNSGLHDNDAPCAVCTVSGRSQKIMIPGRSECEAGWTVEYSGVLVAERSTHTKSTYVCLDGDPETRTGGGGNVNGGLFYAVEADCGYSLPCPPYVEGYELSCVVCTK